LRFGLGLGAWVGKSCPNNGAPRFLAPVLLSSSTRRNFSIGDCYDNSMIESF
jgi:hypothetical protein